MQLAAPAGCEAEARRIIGELLGMREGEKPPSLAARGGVWFEHLHIGIEDDFRPARKAHPAFVVDDVDEVDARIGDVTWDDELPGVRRFYADDPWGNRLEFLQRQ